MYKVDKTAKTIKPIEKEEFSSQDLRERQDLQEWIAKEPDALGEDLLIIQKEFAGFDDTKERLDLLALDEEGQLVVIENKLDDSGRDVTWQALKYASYCSSLGREDIAEIFQEYLDKHESGANAKERLFAFLNDQENYSEESFESLELNQGFNQRVILVAADFRKEVTSTALWLLNHNIQLQCLKTTLFKAEDGQLYLTVEQIIPMKGTEDYMIGYSRKESENAKAKAKNDTRGEQVYLPFWTQLLEAMRNSDSSIYDGVGPVPRHYIQASSGAGGVSYDLVFTKKAVKAELYISRGDKAQNKKIFDHLTANKEAIENEFGEALDWQRLDNKKACRIQAKKEINAEDPGQMPDAIKFLVEALCRLEKALAGPLEQARKNLKFLR